MAQLKPEDITKLAKLANLPLTESDLKEFPDQLSESLAYVENLADIDTSTVPPTFFTTTAKNVMADDEIDESVMLSQKEATKNAQKARDGYFVVKRIL